MKYKVLFLLALLALAVLGLATMSYQPAQAQKELPEHPEAPQTTNEVPSFRIEFCNPYYDGNVTLVTPVTEITTSGDLANVGLCLTELEPGLITDDFSFGWSMPFELSNLSWAYWQPNESPWSWSCKSIWCSRSFDVYSGPSLYVDYYDTGGDTTPYPSARLVRFNLTGWNNVSPGCYQLSPLTASISVYRSPSYVWENADQKSVTIRHATSTCNVTPPPTNTPTPIVPTPTNTPVPPTPTPPPPATVTITPIPPTPTLVPPTPTATPTCPDGLVWQPALNKCGYGLNLPLIRKDQ